MFFFNSAFNDTGFVEVEITDYNDNNYYPLNKNVLRAYRIFRETETDNPVNYLLETERLFRARVG